MKESTIAIRLSFLFLVLFISFSSCKKEDDSNSDYVERFAPGLYPNETISDGPYIETFGSKYIVKWIEKDRTAVEQILTDSDAGSFECDFGFSFDYVKSFHQGNVAIDFTQHYTDVDKLIALSDIHGQYVLFVELLKTFSVIDEQNNWIYGNGHLVIVGDVFDRGNRVTESLWLLFKLEHQADLMGGKVHYLLGNHELMVLRNNLSYLNGKYNTTARRLELTYGQLYSDQSIMGQWLRTKPVIISINDMLFTHAGISSELVNKNISQSDVNEFFLNNIIDNDENSINRDPLLTFLVDEYGPVWYRGYFEDDTFTEDKLDNILNYFNMDHIMVGHTSQERILKLFGGKIFAVDSSIKYGVYGEVLIREHGKFYRGTLNGEKIEL